MKKNIISAIIITLALLSNNLLAQDPPPPPPELNYLKQVEENESEYLQNLSAPMKANLSIIKEMNKKKYLQLLNEARFSSNTWTKFFDGNSRFTENSVIMELEIQSQALAMKYKSGKGNKDEIKNELSRTLEKLLDLKEERRHQELKILKEKIKELEKSIAVRKKNKNEIIRRRVMDMLEESDYYKWD